MKNHIGLILIISIATTIILTACAMRTPVQQPVAPMNIDAMKGITVVFREFKVSPGIANSELALMQCKMAAKGYLQGKNYFKNVEEDSSKTFDSPAMFVDVTLTAFRIVGTGARFWGGFFAGRSHMKLLTTITDAQGNQLAQQELVGSPSAMSGAFSMGGSDSSLPQKMGQLLGDYIIVQANKTS